MVISRAVDDRRGSVILADASRLSKPTVEENRTRREVTAVNRSAKVEASMSTKVTWFGHACFLIETVGKRVLVDPFLDDSPTAPLKSKEVSADFILITHGHFDHIADAAKIATRCNAVCVSNFEICEWLAKQGVQQTEPMNIGGAISLAIGTVKSTIAFHSSTLPDGTPGGNPSGFLLALAGAKIYIAGDTALFSDMQLYAVGLDLAILPIGDRFTMGPEDSLQAIRLLDPTRVVPCHYNTWPPIAQDATAWASRVAKESSSEAIILRPGESVAL
jgi:L-ascorbate metabolism protein UlaG (beta-lactamase superfamily)